MPCYRATPRFASRLPSALRGRCFSPTSATDFPKRAPHRSPDFRAARLAPRRPATANEAGRSPPPTSRRPTPDHLAAIQPRIGVRLTALTQLRSFRALLPPPGGSGCWAGPFSRAAVIRRGVVDRERDRRKRPLTLPVAPRRTRRAEARRLLRGTRTDSTAPASTRTAFPARSAFHRRVPTRPSRDPRARHRSRDFAAALRLPTLLRLPDALARGG